MANDEQAILKDAVQTDIGLVHVMPATYQGGKMPEGSKSLEPSPVEHCVKRETEKKPVPPPQIKRPAAKPLPPKKNPHKRRVLLIVGGGVVFALVIVVLVMFLTSQVPEFRPEPEPIVTVPETPVTSSVVPDEPSTPPELTTPAEPFVKEPTPGRDTDSDGLSDVEERLYGSNPRLPDTDRDGFLDGNEVFHQYDPLTPDPAELFDRGVVSWFEQPLIVLLYPSVWKPSVAFEPPFFLDLVVEAPSGERVSVNTSRMTDGSSLRMELERMAETEKDQSILDVEYSKSKAGHELAMEKDQMRATLAVDGFLIVLRYELGGKNTIDFVQTFQMMVNSLDRASEPGD